MPSLAALLLAVAVAFFVMPNFAAPMLVGAGIFMILAAEYVHWNQFGVSEYQRSTWQYNLRRYGSYVLIGVILVGAYGFYALNTGSSGGSVLPSLSTPSLPALQAPAIGGGVAQVVNTATSRIRELMRKGRIDL